jgi:hypothetical protein
MVLPVHLVQVVHLVPQVLLVQVELQEQAEEMVYLRDKFFISTKVRIVMYQVIKY